MSHDNQEGEAPSSIADGVERKLDPNWVMASRLTAGIWVVILAFVGTKMIISDFYKIPTELSLALVAAILLSAIGASVLFGRPKPLPDGVGHEVAHEPLLVPQIVSEETTPS